MLQINENFCLPQVGGGENCFFTGNSIYWEAIYLVDGLTPRVNHARWVHSRCTMKVGNVFGEYVLVQI